MSIVERALQKAQAKARSDAPASPSRNSSNEEQPVPVETCDPPLPAAGPAVDVPRGDGPQMDASLTARDLKAIVHIDVARLREAGRMPSEESAAQAEDEIRRIKWPLLSAIAGDSDGASARNNVVLVTSALAGEGKSFTALNLALSIVRDRELRVVLVDGDVAKPGLTPALGLEGRRGLIDALEDVEVDTAAITYQTDVDGLYFVPAGKWHAHAPEFLAGSRMPEIIAALSRRVGRGVIILDSPPLLATNEAQVVTRYAGQVLLVVQADLTEQQAVLDAIALLDKATLVSAVLNRVDASTLSRYYGHYYYGDRAGYGHGRRQPLGKGSE